MNAHSLDDFSPDSIQIDCINCRIDAAEKILMQHHLDGLLDELPLYSTISVELRREAGEYRAQLSAAGAREEFKVQARGEELESLALQLKEKMHRQIQSWKQRRFNILNPACEIA